MRRNSTEYLVAIIIGGKKHACNKGDWALFVNVSAPSIYDWIKQSMAEDNHKLEELVELSNQVTSNGLKQI